MAKTNRTTQDFLPIKDIRDGVVLLKNKTLRLVLMVSSINFALKSVDEQTGILLQYQNFLNSLDFSTQILVRSKRLDIKPYIDMLDAKIETQDSDLIKIQTREYIRFVKNFTDSVSIMSKGFFVIIPYTGGGSSLSTKTGFLGGLFGQSDSEKKKTEDENFESQKLQLEQRAVVVEQGLSGCGLRTVRLGTEELIELYFTLLNPGDTSKAPSSELMK